ncbi:MAG: DUF4845 domain-containing protein [Hydrogenophilus sp.]|nr:DUF4845 domain-containing protein [Hydrogenophilus sp.]
MRTGAKGIERQESRGVSLLGVVVGGAAAALAMVLGIRVVPLYVEFFAVQRAVLAVAQEEHDSPQAVRAAFDRRAGVEAIASVGGKDLEVRRDPQRGGWLVTVRYARTVPLFANVSLLFEFEARAP